MIEAIDHIGIAVKDIEASIALYSKIFHPESIHREVVEEQMVDIASFKVGEMRIELTAATSAASPIAKFIEKRGEGIHHVSFRTSSIANDLQRLASDGIQLINDSPQQGAHDMLIAFLHPKSTGGVLMELSQLKTKNE